MKYSLERVIPKNLNPRDGTLLEHIARYQFARDYAHGRVLDLACGVGYGSAYLLDNNPNITELVGIDNADDAIEYAIDHYSYEGITKYYVDDALNENLHLIYGTFDLIVSFETIEHFYGDAIFINNLYNLLKPDGTLIISTPFGKGKNEPCSCPYHVYQYTEREFLDVLAPFKNVTMYHQIDQTIEIPIPEMKYYLMVAVCKQNLAYT